jgi:putative oxidoreductase
MKTPLGFASELVYAVVRVTVGFLFALHGAQKLFPILGTDGSVDLLSRMGAAAVIELVGGGLIALGLWTPWVAFIASGEMAFAYFLTHYPRGPWPLLNGGEPAALYCFVFLFFATRNSGPLSLDRFRSGLGRR